jgi:hypothetical protein
LTSLSAPRTAIVAILIGAFALSACGGNTASSVPTTAGAASVAPTVAATTPPASTAPTSAATDAPPETTAPAGDPADDLEIAPPYTLEPLDEQVAAQFVTAMEGSLGSMGDLIDFGFRSAVKDGDTTAWVVVVRFPDLPMTNKALLDQVSQGASGNGGTVEELTIGGEPARVISAQGQSMVVTLVGDDVVMVIGFISKKASVDVATALIEAN